VTERRGGLMIRRRIVGGLVVGTASALAVAVIAGCAARRRAGAEQGTSVRGPLPRGVMTSSRHTDAWKIGNALLAAPSFIAERAAVEDWPLDPETGEGRLLRRGSNGWTCVPDRPGRPAHNPMCVDETMRAWIAATSAGRKASVDRVGFAYMLLGEARADADDPLAKAPPPGRDWIYVGPHVMVVLPSADRASLLGVNRDLRSGEAYVTAIDSPSPLLVIPVARRDEEIVVKKITDD
jgi:hypothetical protein